MFVQCFLFSHSLLTITHASNTWRAKIHSASILTRIQKHKCFPISQMFFTCSFLCFHLHQTKIEHWGPMYIFWPVLQFQMFFQFIQLKIGFKHNYIQREECSSRSNRMSRESTTFVGVINLRKTSFFGGISRNLLDSVPNSLNDILSIRHHTLHSFKFFSKVTIPNTNRTYFILMYWEFKSPEFMIQFILFESDLYPIAKQF